MTALKIVEDNIKEYGWTQIGTETLYGLPFNYTIGLNECLNHPEIVIVGMSSLQAQQIIINIIEKINEGSSFKNGDIALGIISSSRFGCDLEIKFTDVITEFKYKNLCQAWYHYNGDFDAIQALWPDEMNKFPGDPGYNHRQQFILN